MKKAGLSIVGILAFLLVDPGISAPASPPRPSSQEGQAPTQPLQYEVSVVLKLIHVHVTDKKGTPVLDLTKEDFAVTDNGQPVSLTDFERHALEPAAAEAGPDEASAPSADKSRPEGPAVLPVSRKYFLFFDFAYNNARGILKARKAALHFLDTVVSPGDEVAVLTYSAIGGISFHEFMTTDHAKVRKVLAAIGHEDAAGRATEIEDRYWRLVQEAPGSGLGAAIGLTFRAEAEANRQESKSMAQKYMLRLTDLAKALRLVQGQKHFIFFSTGIPNSLIYGYTPKNPLYRGIWSGGDSAGDYVLRKRNEEMYQEFSVADCSFYAFDTRESAMETSLFLYDEQTFAMNSRALTLAIEPTHIFKDDRTTGLNSLKRFTDITSGQYYSNINMYEKNLDHIRAMTGAYYVLGYSINEQWDGRFHELKVEVKRKGCEVRAQAGYFNPKPFSEYTDLERQLHLFDLALNERAFSRLPVNVPMTALAYAGRGGSRLGVVAHVPPEVTGKLSGKRIEFVVIYFDASGEIRTVVRAETDPTAYRSRAMVFTAGAELKPGTYSCRLVVRDMDTGMSAVASAKTTQEMPHSAGLQLSTPLLLMEGAGSSFLDAGSPKKGDAGPLAEVYAYDRSWLSPIVAELPPSAVSIRAIIPYSVSGEAEPDLALSAYAVDAKSGARTPVTFSRAGRSRNGPVGALLLELPVAGFAPGTYFLHFNAEDRASKSLDHTFTTLVIPQR